MKVPLRWLSVEAMRDNLYSTKSDVWAFGIVLWEIGTLGNYRRLRVNAQGARFKRTFLFCCFEGGFPYPTVSNGELLMHLAEGNRLDQPGNCSDHLYELMNACWKEDPEDRPGFADIVAKLEPSHNQYYVDPYVDFNTLHLDFEFPPTTEEFKKKKAAASIDKKDAARQ